jgi:diacylglycerol kinase (ATP)
MICCTLIALLFGSLIWAARKLRVLPATQTASPLNWTLSTSPSSPQITPAPEKFNWHVRARSFRFAFNGINEVLRSEHSAWIHLGAAVSAIAFGIFLQIDLAAWRWIVFCIGLVIASEIMNTAIENACDAITTEHNVLIGKAKDMGAGAVLLCSITAFIIGMMTFLPYILVAKYPFELDICGF